MRTLDKYLVGFGIWIVLIYLTGLVTSTTLREEITIPLFWMVTFCYVYCLVLVSWPLKMPKINWWALGLLVIGLTMALPLALIGEHILGADAHREYYTFMQTDITDELYIRHGYLITGCLSVTLLPTLFQDAVGAEHEQLFRALYPVLFSIFPVVVYAIARKFVSNFYAFAAGLVVTLQPMFIWTTASARTSLGTLFIALTILALLSEENGWKKTVVLSLLGVGCFLSHYTSAFILIAILACSLLPRVTRWVSILPLFITALGTYYWLQHTGLDWMLTRYF